MGGGPPTSKVKGALGECSGESKGEVGSGPLPSGRRQQNPVDASAVGAAGSVGNLVQVVDPDTILKEDVPPGEFFGLSAENFCTKFPKATPEVIRHAVSLEQMVWHACAFGLSYKASKVQLARALAKMLGEYVGRGQRLKDPDKSEAIKEFPMPSSLQQLERFLGMFN